VSWKDLAVKGAEDGSFAVHEPLGGRMPAFARPANTVRIIAALWL